MIPIIVSEKTDNVRLVEGAEERAKKIGNGEPSSDEAREEQHSSRGKTQAVWLATF